MQDKILQILKHIELDKKYIQLCRDNSDFENRANFTRKDVESIIKSFDPDFKYISNDRTFMKEFLFGDFTVRFFIGFKSGISGFGYLVWKEGENDNYYKGNLVTLTELLDPKFEEKVIYKSPIATSKDDYYKILSKIFEIYNSFKEEFEKNNMS